MVNQSFLKGWFDLENYPVIQEKLGTPDTTIPAQGNPSVDFAAAIYPMSLASGEVS